MWLLKHDQVVVMYAGHVAENADVYSLENPCHPYTIALFKSIPDLVGDGGRLFTIDGMVPSAYNFPEGCLETAVHFLLTSVSPNQKWRKLPLITLSPVTTGVKPRPTMPKKMATQKEQMMSDTNKPMLQVRGLKKYFPIHKGLFRSLKGTVKAVDNISFDLNAKETLGIVGESGCGKTTVGRSLLRLIEPTAGEAHFMDRDIFKLGASELRSFRKNMQIIFQDPYSSLNPRMTIGSIIGDALELHGIAQGVDKFEMSKELLVKVGLQASYINRYPHEFSGGQRQRIGIARAVALHPKFVVCDEAVSALDVSVQAQVINLLQDLQDEYDLSYMFIAHDLSVVKHISNRIAVMYLGRIVELSECDELSQTLASIHTGFAFCDSRTKTTAQKGTYHPPW